MIININTLLSLYYIELLSLYYIEFNYDLI